MVCARVDVPLSRCQMAISDLRRIQETSSEFGLSCAVDGVWYVFEASVSDTENERDVERAMELLFNSNVPGFRLPATMVKNWLHDGKLYRMLSIALDEVGKL